MATMEIQVCIGSGCHLKGAHFVISRLKQLVALQGAETQIKLKASFCQEHCTEGVVLRIDGEVISRVSIENIDAIFSAAVSKR